MAGISNYLADKIGDWMHGNTGGYSPVGTTYFALMTVLPTASGGGTEVSGGSYARLAYINNSTNWPASINGVKSNATLLTWATPTADWGTVVGVAEYDAATNGNLLTYAALATAITVLNTQIFSLPVGAATFTWTGNISSYLSDKLNDWLHGGGTYTVPVTTYFGLMVTSPTQTTPGTESTGGSYARVSDANTLAHWPASVAQTKVNANALSWPTATSDWTAPDLAAAEFDALSGGNVLTFGPLANSQTVVNGSTPVLPANAAVYQVQ